MRESKRETERQKEIEKERERGVLQVACKCFNSVALREPVAIKSMVF